jgi:hypothetical protein
MALDPSGSSSSVAAVNTEVKCDELARKVS